MVSIGCRVVSTAITPSLSLPSERRVALLALNNFKSITEGLDLPKIRVPVLHHQRTAQGTIGKAHKLTQLTKSGNMAGLANIPNERHSK